MPSSKSSIQDSSFEERPEEVSDHNNNNNKPNAAERTNSSSLTAAATRNLRRHDSLDIESRRLRGHPSGHHSKDPKEWSIILALAFQSIGIVYGDIGTSPLYVYSSTFTEGIKDNDDILGVLSLIFYTLTLIPLIKYVFIVLRANDNGDGGTFALYSLICRYAKVGLTPSQEAEDKDVSNFRLELPSNNLERASKIKSKLEKSTFAKYFLLLATMLGTAMVIGDGILTPCISVLSAVGGIKEATSSMTDDMIVWISVVILIGLFLVQRFGTDKVGYTFAPVICLWFVLIGGIGVYNVIKFDPLVIKALNPKYIIDYFRRNKKQAWISLGGVVLCTTGTEALFADVGHFAVRSIQISMCALTYPALVLAYTGQAAFLRKHNSMVAETFYRSIPHPLYWPMFVVAVASAIIASQAMISGTFSIIQQSLALGCFPRVKIVHTSKKHIGQVYVPEANYLLMIACVAVTLAFKNTVKIGNAYGIAVVFVMTLTSSLLVLIMVMIWKTNLFLIMSFVLVIGSVELLYLSSVLYKFDQGGYLPLAFAAFLMIIMFVWNDVYRRKYYYELKHKISPKEVQQITSVDTTVCRIPGLAIVYSELVHGIPPIFKHYVTNVPAVHSVVVFTSIKSLPVSKVPPEERFLFRRVEPRDLNMFRCVARYGYNDVRHAHEPFDKLLVEKLNEFVKDDFFMFHAEKTKVEESRQSSNIADGEANDDQNRADQEDHGLLDSKLAEMLSAEIEVLDRAWCAGVVHLMGENEIVAAKGSKIAKRILIDYAYCFLKKNLRQTEQVFDIPHTKMLKVGMTYEL